MTGGAEENSSDPPVSMYEALFDMTIQICNMFPGITPISLRNEDADEVMRIIYRLAQHKKREYGQRHGAMQPKQTKKRVYADTATGGWS